MINWKNRSYTEEEFRTAWTSNASYSNILEALNLNKSGGSVRIIKETAEELGLNTEHFHRKQSVRYTLDEILIENSPYKCSTTLFKRLVREGIKELKCEDCGLTEWMGRPIPLQLDHVNGNNRDNRLDNLRVLCNNCHGLTETWCGKNKVRKTSTGNFPGIGVKEYLCACGNSMDPSAKTCLDCYNLQNHEKIEYPPVEEMILNIEKLGYLPYSKILGVSDNTIRQVLRRRGIDPLPKKKK